MSGFVRRNLFIVLGISLPLALVALIVGIQFAARSKVDPPLTPVLYVRQSSWFDQHQFEFRIDGRRLRVSFRRSETEPQPRLGQPRQIEIGLYDPRSATLESFVLQAPAIEAIEAIEQVGVSRPIELPARLADLQFDDGLLSPDGFRFEAFRPSRSGVLGELFGYGSANTRFRLTRDGVGFPLPGDGGYADGDAFIGWVVDEEQAR